MPHRLYKLERIEKLLSLRFGILNGIAKVSGAISSASRQRSQS